MKVLGLIPARGGSKRLPRKNLAQIGGRSLVAIAIDAAREAGLDTIAVSTDDNEIASEANRRGALFWTRPSYLATDTTPSLDVLTYHLGTDLDAWDLVVLLQPTSPFRSAADIRNALAILDAAGGDAVISITDAQADCVYQVGHAGRLRAVRELPGLVVPNGAIYAITTLALAEGRDWWSGVTYGYRMPRSRSLDIDTAEDLATANRLWEIGHGN